MPRPPRPTKAQRQALTPALEHWLLTGCYWGSAAPDSGFNYEAFLLAGDVTRRQSARLRELWAGHGDAVRAQDGRGPIFVEVVLTGAAWQWPTRVPWRCIEHPDRRPGRPR